MGGVVGQHAGRDGVAQPLVGISHRGAPALAAVSPSSVFTSDGFRYGCLARIRAQMPVMCGVAKLLPVERMRSPPIQATLDVDPAGEELDRRGGVAVVGERIVQVVACDRDHRREPPRVARDRHVVRRGDDDAAAEVRRVGQLVQRLDEPVLGGGEAHVDDVVALRDRPPQPLDEHRAAADEALAEHAHADELAVGRDLADDAGARGAVPAQVAQRVGLDQHLVVLDRHGDRRRHIADQWVPRLDAAVDDAHPRAGAGRAAERPVAGDALRPRMRARERLHGRPVDGVGGKGVERCGLGHCRAMVPNPVWRGRWRRRSAGGATRKPPPTTCARGRAPRRRDRRRRPRPCPARPARPCAHGHAPRHRARPSPCTDLARLPPCSSCTGSVFPPDGGR